MGLCVAFGEDGTLIPTGQPVDQCAGYVLMSSAEASTVSLIAEAFQPPTKEQLAVWAVSPMALILFFFVVARIAGSVASFFNTNR
ncbi:hypothetical protein E5C33_10800 [Stenotrophomonas maltophilia]|nr:hypothetical protein E5C33_10800 [Stenotrophomonas maltophilia]